VDNTGYFRDNVLKLSRGVSSLKKTGIKMKPNVVWPMQFHSCKIIHYNEKRMSKLSQRKCSFNQEFTKSIL